MLSDYVSLHRFVCYSLFFSCSLSYALFVVFCQTSLYEFVMLISLFLIERNLNSLNIEQKIPSSSASTSRSTLLTNVIRHAFSLYFYFVIMYLYIHMYIHISDPTSALLIA